MAYNYRLSEEAESDIYDSYIWYENQKEGLGEEFLSALEAAQQAILKSPKTYRVRYKKKVRSFLVDRFPYMILYVVNEESIDVISVFNTYKHPKGWKKRVK